MITTMANATRLDPDLATEVVPGALAELNQPVTLVSEPLTGSVGQLGVLTLAFVGRRPSPPSQSSGSSRPWPG